MESPTLQEMRRLRGILSFQFGIEICDSIMRGDLKVVCSKRTGRIRYIYRDGRLVGVLRPRSGNIALTLEGAKIASTCRSSGRFTVFVKDEVSIHVAKGGDLFAKHVLEADDDLRCGEEVIVKDEGGRIVAVGVSRLSGEEMKSFTHGIAVKTRKGILEE